MTLRAFALLCSGALATTACTTPPPAAAPVASATPARLMTWPDLLARPRPAADKSFRYGADPYQIADLWLPKGDGPHPVVLMVHGGCWTTSIADRTLMNWAAADLRARGIAVWNIDYRGVDRPGGAPDGIFADTAAAADLLRIHASANRLNTRRIVAVGHSAGGHLALWLAGRHRLTDAMAELRTNALPLRHVVSLGGLPDLDQARRERQGCGIEPVVKLLVPAAAINEATTDPEDRLRLRNKSIPSLAPLGVSQTLINGDADMIIPPHFATDYAARMRAAGDHVTVRMIPNQGHVELITPGTPAWAAAVAAIQAAVTPRRSNLNQ